MPHVYADRVREVTTSTGPGNVTLAGAAPGGFATFAARIGVGNTTEVCMVDPASGEWEAFATELLSATVLQRGTLLASSTGSRVSFATGVKQVYVCQPAAEIMRRTEIVAALAAPGGGGVYARAGSAWVEVPQRAVLVEVTGTSYTPAVGPDGRWFLGTNAAGCAMLVPTHAAQPHPLGTLLTFEQDAAGSLVFTGDTGVTVRPPPDTVAETNGIGSVVQIHKRTATFWTIFGNLKAA